MAELRTLGRTTARAAQLWLGTLVEITATTGSAGALHAALAAAFAAIARVHRALSAHEPDSELSRVNHCAASTPQEISADFRAVLGRALDIAQRSDGAFDPTIGGIVAALGFLPPQASSDRRASWRDVELDAHGVRFARPLALDFGGIGKGYAVDCAVAALRDNGAVAGRVNAGGDLRIFGTPEERVHIRTGGPQSIVVPLVAVTDGAVATSAYGGQRRYIGGRWATPLIDPVGRTPRMSTRTVSVIAADCMTADALTKVVALQGVASSQLLAAYGASAAILSPARGRWRCTRLPRRGNVAD